MRQILFRGKDRNYSKWVFGDLAHTPSNQPTIKVNPTDPIFYDVLPDTVGQYTGLRDSAGTQIFEGDIVRISIRPTLETAELNKRNAQLVNTTLPSWINGGDIIARVSFFDTAFHFITLKTYLPPSADKQEPMLHYLFQERHPEYDSPYTQTLTVIGNIHDNKNLLSQNLKP